MSVDVGPVISALEDAGSAIAVVGVAVLLLWVAVACFRYLRLTVAPGVSADGGKAERMQTYRELRSDGWSPAEIEQGTRYSGPGSTHYGP
jgi:hypothetical protein